jgi:hypothetical protein
LKLVVAISKGCRFGDDEVLNLWMRYFCVWKALEVHAMRTLNLSCLDDGAVVTVMGLHVGRLYGDAVGIWNSYHRALFVLEE